MHSNNPTTWHPISPLPPSLKALANHGETVYHGRNPDMTQQIILFRARPDWRVALKHHSVPDADGTN